MSTKIEIMEQSKRDFLPAAGKDWLLPLYDPFTRLMGGDRAKKKLVNQAGIQAGQKILDIGCGTGTLSVSMKKDHSDIQVIGLDPDVKALSRAKKKAQQAGLSIQFDQGFSDQLPYPDASFDHIFSTLMFHHLKEAEKGKTLQEVRRVLKSNGVFHLLDFTRLKNNSEEQLLTLMKNAGFKEPKIMERGSLFFLRITYFYAAA